MNAVRISYRCMHFNHDEQKLAQALGASKFVRDVPVNEGLFSSWQEHLIIVQTST